MWIVTGAALTFVDGRMPGRSVLHPLSEITMAIQAELFLRFRGHPFIVAGVGIMAGHAVAVFIRHVNGGGLFREKVLFVAGGTQFFTRGLEELLVVGAVAEVTGGALPALHRLVDAGFQKLTLQAGVTGIADGIGSAGQEMFGAGAMRVMTTRAHVLRERAVLLLILRCGRTHVRMTSIAKVTFRLIHQTFEGSGMGRVTGQTAICAFKRRVWKTHHLAGIFMTVKTQVIALSNEQGLMLGGVRIMAREAIPRLERFVLHSCVALHGGVVMTPQTELFGGGIQAERLLGGGGIVTGVTLGAGHRVVQAALEQVGIF